MRFIQRFERRLEGAVDDAFARVFGGKIMPAEVESALRREADQGLRMHGDRALVPNHFVLTVSDSDEENLTADAELTMRSFATHLSGYIDDQGWETYGDVSVELQSSPALHTGQFRARSTVDPDPAAPADPPPAQPQHTGVPQMPPHDQSAPYDSPGRTSGPLPSERYAARAAGRLTDPPAPGQDPAPSPYPAPPQGAPPYDLPHDPPRDRAAADAPGEPAGHAVGPDPYTQAPPQGAAPGYPLGEYAPGYGPYPPQGRDPRGYEPPHEPEPQYGAGYGPQYGAPDGGYPPYPRPGYGAPVYDRPDYGDPRYAPPGHPPQSHPQQGYPQPNHPQPGYDHPGHPPTAAWSEPRAQGVRLMLDDGSGRTYDLRDGSNVIGRGQACHFRVPDTGVSRRHVNIEWNGAVALLVDMRSTNGTVVNGNPVTEWQLAHGDIVRIGHTDIAVQFR